MAFAESSKAFFDELSSILDRKQADKEEDIDKRTDRPFSSLLTQDEEPTDDGNPNTMDMDESEPQVVTRSYA